MHGYVLSRAVLLVRGLGILLLGVRVRSEVLDQRLTSERARAHQISGGKSGGETPVPIPNTEVKTASADGTWGETPRESRSPPDLCDERPRRSGNACAGALVAFGGLRRARRYARRHAETRRPQAALPARRSSRSSRHRSFDRRQPAAAAAWAWGRRPRGDRQARRLEGLALLRPADESSRGILPRSRARRD